MDRTEDAKDSDTRLNTLPNESMEEIAEMELDALRKQETLHAKVKLLLAYLKAEVNVLYYELQRQIHTLAIKNHIHATLFYMHLGQVNWMQGTTNYSNFCQMFALGVWLVRSKEAI